MNVKGSTECILVLNRERSKFRIILDVNLSFLQKLTLILPNNNEL